MIIRHLAPLHISGVANQRFKERGNGPKNAVVVLDFGIVSNDGDEEAKGFQECGA